MISTLGARYIGEGDTARFRQLGHTLGAGTLAIALSFAGAGYVFSERIFKFYDCNSATLALLEDQAVVIVFIFSVVVGLITSVPVGMIVAAQQFRAQATIYVSGLFLAYAPTLLYAASSGTGKASLGWLYLASTMFGVWKLLGTSYCALVMVPRRLEARRRDRVRIETGSVAPMPQQQSSSGAGPGARMCDYLLFGGGGGGATSDVEHSSRGRVRSIN